MAKQVVVKIRQEVLDLLVARVSWLAPTLTLVVWLDLR
jgi:hypothetical protein